MKNNAILIFTRTLFVLFGIGTIVTLYFVYSGIESGFAFKFAMGYMFLTLFLLVYVPLITFLNARKLQWSDVKIRLLRFIILSVVFAVINTGVDFFLRNGDISLYRVVPNALGLAFGISFIDVVLLRKKLN